MKTIIFSLLIAMSTQAQAREDSFTLYCTSVGKQTNGLNLETVKLEISTEHPEACLDHKIIGAKYWADSSCYDYEGSDLGYTFTPMSDKSELLPSARRLKNGSWSMNMNHEVMDTYSQLACAKVDSHMFFPTRQQTLQLMADDCLAAALPEAVGAVIEAAQDAGVDYPEEIDIKSMQTIRKGSQYLFIIPSIHEDLIVNVLTEKVGRTCKVVQ
jgi:hypothetical protein